jgi:hypothetical protein
MKAKEDAHEILLGNMSIATDKYVREMPNLKGWIIDAMEQYANQRVIEELEDFAENRLSKDILSEKLILAFELRINELKQ